MTDPGKIVDRSPCEDLVQGRPWFVWTLVLAVFTLSIFMIGCTRRQYRLRADRASYGIIASNMQDPQWAVPPFSVQPPPASRNFDRTNPDRPPMPPDDPAAHVYMHVANGKKGSHKWHKNGDIPWIQDPSWLKFLPLDDEGNLVLDRDRSVEVGLLHSREFQLELEQLYLTALALTFERFEFQLQWFGTNVTDYLHHGDNAPGNPNFPDESNRLTTASNLGFNRAFTTGGQLLVDFANLFVWEFAGDHPTTAFSNLSVQLSQPLLRGAFKDVRMAPLTQAERNVLYKVREFARFRKKFYFDTVSGNQGYLSLLLQVQAIRNLEANLASLRQDLELHEALETAGLVSLLQVDLVFQRYQTGRLALVQARNQLETSKDLFKVQLGLPPELEVKIDDEPLRPFELNSPETEELEDELTRLITTFRERDEPPPREEILQGFDKLRSLRSRVREQYSSVVQEYDRWKSRETTAIAGDDLAREQEADAKRELGVRLEELREDFETNLRTMEAASKLAQSQPLEDAWTSIQTEIRGASALLSEVFVIQTQIRAYLLELEPLEYEEAEEAIRFALARRLDLMNSRGAVVDAWRQIRVTANSLESDLDVFAETDLNTDFVGGNPIKFESPNNRYRVGVRFDGPLNRLAERNEYRASLIQYQQARRQFITDRDSIVRAIRLDLRNLRADRINFSITRQQLIVAARQVELARVQLLSPEAGAASDSSRTRDALNALNSLLSAKNALIGTWVAYETDRLQLLFDMEALQLDERGLRFNGDDTNLGNGTDQLEDGIELIEPPEPQSRDVFGS